MQNKPNFPHFSSENDDLRKNKANLTQFKPNLTQFKAKTNPTCRKSKNERFCVDKDL